MTEHNYLYSLIKMREIEPDVVYLKLIVVFIT